MVRVKGVEPPRLAAPDPKSGASANSATPAYKWLGYQDSNLGMTESKSVALPLGYTPKIKWWRGADSNCRTRRSGFTVRRV